jgi:hypothetical protein
MASLRTISRGRLALPGLLLLLVLLLLAWPSPIDPVARLPTSFVPLRVKDRP